MDESLVTSELRFIHFFGPDWAPKPEDHAPEIDSVEGPDDAPSKAGNTPPMPEPPGAKLSEAIAAGLRERGWNCDYQWVTYRGHGIDARRVKYRYDIVIWLCDAEAGRWELIAEPRRGLFRRLFQQKGDPNEHTLLRIDIEETLESLQGVDRVSPWRRVPFEGGG